MMNINLTNNVAQANLITHDRVFRTDTFMATVILSRILDNLTVCLTSEVPENVIIYNVEDGNGTCENGASYISRSLWRDFGREVLNRSGCSSDLIEFVWSIIDHTLIEVIDSIVIDSTENNESFKVACGFVDHIFDTILTNALPQAFIEKAIETSEGNIIVLDRFVPSWEDLLFASSNPKANQIKYVIVPALNNYRCHCVSKAPGSLSLRKKLPETWQFLGSKELYDVTGVEAICSHANHFECKKLADAIAMAKLAAQA